MERSNTNLPDKIECWFDFGSGYAYFGAHDLCDVADRHGIPIVWRPNLLKEAFALTGATGLSETPLKSDYALLDWQRIARLKGMTFNPVEGPRRSSLLVLRSFYWIEKNAPEKTREFVLETFDTYYAQARDYSDPSVVGDIVDGLGLSRAQVADGANDPEIKATARDFSDEAIRRGIFGSPYFVVDGEPFWGWDRLPMLEQWIKQRGW